MPRKEKLISFLEYEICSPFPYYTTSASTTFSISILNFPIPLILLGRLLLQEKYSTGRKLNIKYTTRKICIMTYFS